MPGRYIADRAMRNTLAAQILTNFLASLGEPLSFYFGVVEILHMSANA